MIYDFHQHPLWKGATTEALLCYLTRNDITKCVLHTLDALGSQALHKYQKISIDDVWSVYMQNPDVFIPFFAPDPEDEDCCRKLKFWAKEGIKGFGEHKVRLGLNDPRSRSLYYLCADYNLPVLFHIENNFDGRFQYNMDISAVGAICRDLPVCRFVAHGPEFWRHIEKHPACITYPRTRIAQIGEVHRLLGEHGNLYADISGFSGLNAMKRDLDMAAGFLDQFKDRILFGVDSLSDEHCGFMKGLCSEGVISEQTYRRIMYANARQLLGV